ncbi:restriction endonuclease subunit S [Acinetobacter seifertii]|uniref:restriction endonuclease subunit S n=1 Tax=Acinetobacter seifertii TaxID=1530123 RepID=UPI0015808FF3|nr:restriction endonuclease subunit S [Acinetobacter seifertii]NUE92387.1 restriction endonuclease subunit S [Acinetobacter seifertii]
MASPKLRFKEFDGDWSKFSILDLSKDKTLNNGVFNDQNKVGKGYKLINVLDMYIERDIDEARLSLLDIDSKEFERNKVRYGDIFFTRSSLVKEGIAFSNVYLGNANDVTYDGHLIKLSPDLERVNPLFLNFSLKTANARKQLIQGGKTATMTTIGQKEVGSCQLDIPSKKEQIQIASFLSAVDEKVSQLTQKHMLLSQYKQGMMQKLFSQQIRFKADDGGEFGEWEDIQLKDFLNLTLRPISKPENNYHALGVRSHFKGLFNKYNSEPEKISMDTLYRVEKDDVVVNITFAWEGAMAIAKSEHDQGLVSHRFPTYRCDESSVHLLFFKYRFIQKDFLSHLQLCSPGGAGRNRVLNKKAFLEINFSKPCLEEQTKIANFLSAIDQKIEVVANQIEHAKQWKKGLLQQMFV